MTHISNSLGTDQSGGRIVRPRAQARRRRRWWMPRKAPGTGRSTSRKSAAISWPFPATRCAGRRASASCMAARKCSKTCRRTRAAGEMILNVDFQRSTWKHAPHKFEAGTPDISGAVGLHAAMDYLDAIGREQHRAARPGTGAYAYAQLSRCKRHPPLRPAHRARRAGELPAEKTSTPMTW